MLVSGAADAPLVLLLHGFSESLHMWRAQLPALAAAGYRAVAPSQRGYSAGARPDTKDTSNYATERLIADALDIARGRSRVPFEAGRHNIHSLAAYAIDDVKLSPGEDRAVRVEIAMSNSAGIYQVDELLAALGRIGGCAGAPPSASWRVTSTWKISLAK